MESRFLQKLIVLGLLVSCSPKPSEPLSLDPSLLKNGDLLCRYGNGFFSKYFRQVSDSVPLYSHVGLVHVTEDSIHVIHAEASELTFVGYVRREPLHIFLKDVDTWGIFRLDRPDSIRNEITQVALGYHNDRVPFDMDFSLKDDKEIYCTELIGLSFNKILGEEFMAPKTTMMGKLGYSVDDTFLVDGIFEVAHSEESE